MPSAHAELRWHQISTELLAGAQLSSNARKVGALLLERGALFFDELVRGSHLLRTQVEEALGELLGAGVATCDLWAGVRAFITPLHKRAVRHRDGSRSNLPPASSMDVAGRWSLVRAGASEVRGAQEASEQLEKVARLLLLRWGVVLRAVLEQESKSMPPWRELVRVFHRMEARGEIRGGRIVALHTGEQFAFPEAVQMLRSIRNHKPLRDERVTLSAVDPLALGGVVMPGTKTAAIERNRVVFVNGVQVDGDVSSQRVAVQAT